MHYSVSFVEELNNNKNAFQCLYHYILNKLVQQWNFTYMWEHFTARGLLQEHNITRQKNSWELSSSFLYIFVYDCCLILATIE